MNCPDRDQLSGYVLGTLPKDLVATLAEHVQHCQQCEATLLDLKSQADSVAGSPKDSAKSIDAVQPEGHGTDSKSEKVHAAKTGEHSLSLGLGEAGKQTGGAAAPGTAPTREQFLKHLADSGLMVGEAVATFEQSLPSDQRPKDSQELARLLVQYGKLTKFQAAAVFQGKIKGLVFGEYTVLERIGAGGMGAVFKAEHRRMKRVVALKVLPQRLTRSPEALKRFEREVQAAARLSHPNIVAAFDAGAQDGMHFLVMEYVAGQDLGAVLRSHVEQQRPLPVRDVIGYLIQAARGLDYAHAQGIVHRDIKPGNLLLDASGVVKILDMGLARTDDGSSAMAASQEGLTIAGQVMGTVDYMAPEQALNLHLADARSDIYSLGCTLYRLVVGANMYGGQTLVEKILAHRQNEIPALCAGRQDAPAALDQVYRRMVAKRPEDRYQTMSEVVADLERVLTGAEAPAALASLAEPSSRASTRPAASPKSQPWKNPRMLAIGAAAAVVLALFGWYLLGVILKVETQDGTLVLEVNQPDAVVRVLNERNEVEISQPGGAGKITIGVHPGKHRLKVEKDGFQYFVNDFEIESGGKASIKATLTPIKKEQPPVVAQVKPAPQQVPTPTPVAAAPAVATKTPSPANQPSFAKAPFNAQQAQAHQQSWASHLRMSVETTNSIGMKIVLIPPGEFMMGSTPEQTAAAEQVAIQLQAREDTLRRIRNDERPQHRMVIAKPFGMASTEVTVGQFKAFVDEAHYQTEAERFGGGDSSETEQKDPLKKDVTWSAPGYPVNHDSAVTQITWNDAVAFCNWLSQREKLNPVYRLDPEQGWMAMPAFNGYRLPTEAEWEYACRAGTTTERYFGDDAAQLDLYAWYVKNFRENSARQVGLKPANPFGLLDIYGNVAEWCQDWYEENWYEKAPPDGLNGPSTGTLRTMRGGTATDSVLQCRSAWRIARLPTSRMGIRGFRVACGVPPSASAANNLATSTPPAAIPQPAVVSTASLPAVARAGESPLPAKAPFNAQQAKAHQQSWASHLRATIETTNSIGMKMVLIPPGEFLMGSSPAQIDAALKVGAEQTVSEWAMNKIRDTEGPQRRVLITKPIWMGTTEVTVSQFAKFATATRYVTETERDGGGMRTDNELQKDVKDPTRNWQTPGYEVNEDSAVTQLTWGDAVALCNWLSEQEKKKPCYRLDAKDGWVLLPGADGYRLPTEAEWEYACRAGTATQFSFGDDEAQLQQYAWYGNNAGANPSRTVRLKPANPFGLYDMHGNVEERCHDWYDAKWYEKAHENEPYGPSSGSTRVCRGGSVGVRGSRVRSAFRADVVPTYRHTMIGFRVVRGLDIPAPAAASIASSQPVAPPAAAATPSKTVAPPQPRTTASSGANLFAGERPPAGAKTPLPDTMSQQKALELVKQVFQTDYAKAVKPEEKRELSEKLLAQVVKTPDDAVARYVLACEARDLAVELTDLPLIERAIEMLSGEFDFDQHLMLAETYQKLVSKPRPTDANRSVTESALNLLAKARDAGSFEAAEKLAKVASTAATKARDATLTKTAKAKSDELATLKQAWEVAQKAAAKLADSPDDADAHLALGKYLCFQQGNWEQGLPHLSRGSDATLKELAAKGLTAPQDASVQVEMGDAWWNAAEKVKGKDKAGLQAGAQFWYTKSLPALTGLNRAKVQKRLADLGGPSSAPALANAGAPSGTSTTATGSNSGTPPTKTTAKARPKTSGAAPPSAVAPFAAAAAQQHQQRWAAYLRSPVQSTNSIGMSMVLIPPGEFMMGSTSEQTDAALKIAIAQQLPDWGQRRIRDEEWPQHRVVITRSFSMSATEVTLGQFKRFVEATRYVTEAERSGGGFRYDNELKKDVRDPARGWLAPGYPVNDNSAVTQVTWSDAVEFCNWLNQQEKLTPSYRHDDSNTWVLLPTTDSYRLPTEAEWEYACRSGSNTQYSFGDDSTVLEQFAWYGKNNKGENPGRGVGLRLPNAFGLFDMHGNLNEWCHDFHDGRWYEKTPNNDPQGPASGRNRVLRGGAWYGIDSYCRSAGRQNNDPSHDTNSSGFRIVRGGS